MVAKVAEAATAEEAMQGVMQEAPLMGTVVVAARATLGTQCRTVSHPQMGGRETIDFGKGVDQARQSLIDTLVMLVSTIGA